MAQTTLFLDIYLLRLKLHFNGLITIMLSVTAFINDFILTFRREKSLGQVITIRPVYSVKVLQFSSNVNCNPILL